MKRFLILIAISSVSMIAGCGNGDAGNPSPVASQADASTQANQPPLAVPPPSSVEAPNPAVATQAIDPPSPPIAMSAGVTETIDAPRPASALAQTIAPSDDGSSSLASQQVAPVVHYPPDPATGSDD
jgi:hypothetical protein